jgi:hypothetical protein
VLGLLVVAVTAVSTGIAALAILGHPGGLWQVLAVVSIVNALATLFVALRPRWGRPAALSILGAQVVGAIVGLAVVAFVELRDLPNVQEALSLLLFIFVPVVASIVFVSLLAAWSINRLEWPST